VAKSYFAKIQAKGARDNETETTDRKTISPQGIQADNRKEQKLKSSKQITNYS
jgi:hypothetical protein